MASTAEQVEGSATAAAPAAIGVSFVPMLAAMIIAILLVLAALGGGAFWLLRSGRLTGFGASASASTKVVPAVLDKTREVALEPLLVNLADEGGRAYLRLTMTLVMEDKGTAAEKEAKPEKGKPVIEHEAALRDAALTVIGHETSDELLSGDGKDKLKQQVIAAMTSRVPQRKISQIYFTEFLVQR